MSPKTMRLIGVVATLWNCVGVANYLVHVGLFGEAARPQGEVVMPMFVTAAFAIAVFGGVIGSVGLAMLKSWAKPALWLSFIATVVNWAWVLTYSDQASMPLGIAVLVISLALALIAGRAPLTK